MTRPRCSVNDFAHLPAAQALATRKPQGSVWTEQPAPCVGIRMPWWWLPMDVFAALRGGHIDPERPHDRRYSSPEEAKAALAEALARLNNRS